MSKELQTEMAYFSLFFLSVLRSDKFTTLSSPLDVVLFDDSSILQNYHSVISAVRHVTCFSSCPILTL